MVKTSIWITLRYVFGIRCVIFEYIPLTSRIFTFPFLWAWAWIFFLVNLSPLMVEHVNRACKESGSHFAMTSSSSSSAYEKVTVARGKQSNWRYAILAHLFNSKYGYLHFSTITITNCHCMRFIFNDNRISEWFSAEKHYICAFMWQLCTLGAFNGVFDLMMIRTSHFIGDPIMWGYSRAIEAQTQKSSTF